MFARAPKVMDILSGSAPEDVLSLLSTANICPVTLRWQVIRGHLHNFGQRNTSNVAFPPFREAQVWRSTTMHILHIETAKHAMRVVARKLEERTSLHAPFSFPR